MSEWKREEKCKTCKEEWFDQDNCNIEGNCKQYASKFIKQRSRMSTVRRNLSQCFLIKMI